MNIPHCPLIDGDGDLYTPEMMCSVFTIFHHLRALRGSIWGDRTLRATIIALYDHEGALTVTWDRPPSGSDRELIETAWRAAEPGPILHCWPTMQPGG